MKTTSPSPALTTSSTPRWNPWPWAIVTWFIGFFGVVVGLTTTAIRSRTDVVSPDYYAQELRFQERIEASARTEALAAQPTVVVDSHLHSLRLQLPPGVVPGSDTGKITLYRPDDARLDQEFPLKLDTTGAQLIPVASLRPGRWKVRIAWQSQGHEFYHETTVRLMPGV